MKKGFTLIELMTAVLIVGVLASMALSQYEKAVWQGRNVQLKQSVRSIVESQRLHFMKTGKVSKSFNGLTVSLPLKVKKTNYGAGNVCQLLTLQGEGVLEGDNFAIVLNSGTETSGAVMAVWTKGKYKCNGFSISLFSKTLRCMEARNGSANIREGAFCEDLESATLTSASAGWARYNMP